MQRPSFVPAEVPVMKVFLAAAIIFALTVAGPAAAQERRPVVALTGGLGNSLGGLGAGVEHYLARSRVSASAGLGYWPGDLCDGTLSGAAAVRGFIGSRHRGFLELSYSLLAISCTLAGDDIAGTTVLLFHSATATPVRTASPSPLRAELGMCRATSGPSPSSC